jgi:isoaspartyl peptidase/L-asparaginase-like protein (Ntn-hydrolase superfamily)
LLSKIGNGCKPQKQGMIRIRSKGFILAGLLACGTIAFGAAPAHAVEQCRFIQAKTEREACYQRQEAELAAKRKPAEPRRDAMMDSLERMKQEDQALDRQIHGICRGC